MDQDAAFRGNSPAKIDDKGRLKIPSVFRGIFAAKESREVFVTSAQGDYVRIYPLPAWIEIEKRIQREQASATSTDLTGEALAFFYRAASHWGQMAEIDGQDRILIHPRLRDLAQVVGEVEVEGALTHLAVWEHGRYNESFRKDQLRAEHMAVLKKLGI